MRSEHAPGDRATWRMIKAILLLSLAITAFFLIAEHRVHLFGGSWAGPMLLLAFIALHILMHALHGAIDPGHSRSGAGKGNRAEIDDE